MLKIKNEFGNVKHSTQNFERIIPLKRVPCSLFEKKVASKQEKKKKNQYNKHDLIARATIKIMFEKMPEADSFV